MEKTRQQVAPMDLFALFPPDRWQSEAMAYLDAAAELFERMSRGEFEPTWPRAKAAAFLFSHGLELFFKAAIAQSGEVFLWGHDLERLHAVYREHFPDDVFILRSNVDVFVKQNAPIPFYDFLKYPERIDEINKAWPAAMYIDVTAWHTAVARTATEIRRVWPLLVERFPLDATRWKNPIDGEFEKPRKQQKTIYVLQHTRVSDDGQENVKLIGVYSQRARAEAAVGRLISQPGFRDTPSGFSIDGYELDHDHWTEGFGA